MKKTELSLRERRFVDAFLGTCAGNGTRAAIVAGYSRNGADVQAVRLLGKARVRNVIEARTARASAASIATADERDRLLTSIMRMSTAELHARIRAISELNKCTGRHSMRHTIEGKLTLEQALGESRAAE
jgi:phage terminase small subunit